MVDIPKIKKKVNAFLVGEEGKISKESLIKTGALLSMFALNFLKQAQVATAHVSTGNKYEHTNESGFERTTTDVITGKHRNDMHAEAHTSHSSHGSHCSGAFSCHWW